MAGNPLRVYHSATGKIQELNSFAYIGEVWSIADFSDSVILIGGSSNIVAYHLHTGLTNTVSYLNKKHAASHECIPHFQIKGKGLGSRC